MDVHLTIWLQLGTGVMVHFISFFVIEGIGLQMLHTNKLVQMTVNHISVTLTPVRKMSPVPRVPFQSHSPDEKATSNSLKRYSCKMYPLLHWVFAVLMPFHWHVPMWISKHLSRQPFHISMSSGDFHTLMLSVAPFYVRSAEVPWWDDCFCTT